MRLIRIILTLTILLNIHCYAKQNNRNPEINVNEGQTEGQTQKLKLGIEREMEYLPFLKNKKVVFSWPQSSSKYNKTGRKTL